MLFLPKSCPNVWRELRSSPFPFVQGLHGQIFYSIIHQLADLWRDFGNGFFFPLIRYVRAYKEVQLRRMSLIIFLIMTCVSIPTQCELRNFIHYSFEFSGWRYYPLLLISKRIVKWRNVSFRKKVFLNWTTASKRFGYGIVGEERTTCWWNIRVIRIRIMLSS